MRNKLLLSTFNGAFKISLQHIHEAPLCALEFAK